MIKNKMHMKRQSFCWPLDSVMQCLEASHRESQIQTLVL